MREVAFEETFSEAFHLIIVRKRTKWALVALVVAFGLLQLTNASRVNPVSTPGRDALGTNAPPEIATMLRSACYDCHSHETHWPWYGHVAPVSWWLDDHVRDARSSLNFSDWPNDNPQKAAKKWNRVSESVRGGDMPLHSYTLIHKSARLTDAQRTQLADWAEQEAQRLRGSDTNASAPQK